MKLLVIGGTEFLGRALVDAALARGDAVTLFNRGRSHPELFPDVEHIRGDRTVAADVAALRNGRWDAAIDTCGYVSADVRTTTETLADRVEHYTFISSISVYADNGPLNQDEAAPLATLTDQPENGADGASYGARKALCEHAAETTMLGRVLHLRAGLLVGPHDYTDRFPYWVGRVAQGGTVLAPGDPAQRVQLIDVRDMAAWNLVLAERRQTGVFNVTGPNSTLTMGEMVATCRAASGSEAEFVWVDEKFLLAHNVVPWSELPLWLPATAEYAGFMHYDCAKAFAAGLTCRPLVETTRDTLAWLQTRSNVAPKRAMVAAQGQIGLTSERETALLHEWQQSNAA